MRSQLREMDPVDDFVTQMTPGLEIFQKVWGDMQCAYHKFAPGTDFTALTRSDAEASVRGSALGIRAERLDGGHLRRRVVRDLQRRGRVLLARSTQLQVRERGRNHSVQHLRRVGQAGRCDRRDHGKDGAGPAVNRRPTAVVIFPRRCCVACHPGRPHTRVRGQTDSSGSCRKVMSVEDEGRMMSCGIDQHDEMPQALTNQHDVEEILR